MFVELFEELAIIGDAMEEEERVIILLSSLSDRFSTLVTAIEAHEKIPALSLLKKLSVPCSFPQEEKHEDSEGELELRRSTRNKAAPDRFGGWVAFCTKEIHLVYCPLNDMLADIFTKGLSAEKFSRLRRKLGVVFFEKHIQCEKEC
ncbi:hypothetical protein FHG87_023183 [Trinorchestia longiramus]|nr:hypothetical protein FHG87_023183 [Trinorchestia longiramus]